MRLIDADAKELVNRININFGGVTRFVVKSILKDAPTIDAVPVDKIHFTDLYLDGSEAIAVFKFGNQGITLRKRCEDFAPVVHGRWVNIGGDEWRCSVCGNVESTEGRWEPIMDKFCRECGAKMDGGNDEAD